MRIFYDVDTQNDFMNKDGALYVPDAESIKPNLDLLTDFAKRNNIPVLGSVDRHFGTRKYKDREGELTRYGGPFPDHCMDGEEGQLKIVETVLKWDEPREGYDKGQYVPHLEYHGFPEEPLPKREAHMLKREIFTQKEMEKRWKQLRKGVLDHIVEEAVKNTQNALKGKVEGIYFEKQNYDVFTNLMTEVVLRKADVKEAVVYGVATDYCVKAAVLGMQKRGIRTFVVIDAIKGVFPESTDKSLEEMTNAGARLVKTKEILERSI